MDRDDRLENLSVEELERLLEIKRRAQVDQARVDQARADEAPVDEARADEARADEHAKLRGKRLRRTESAQNTHQRPSAVQGQAASRQTQRRRYQSRRLRPKRSARSATELARGEPERRFRSLRLAQFAEEKQSRRQTGGFWARLGERFLLLIEVGAAIGLIVLLVTGALQLRFLNQETAEALEVDLATPTSVAMLPGGSIPPTPAAAPPLYSKLLHRVTPIVLPTPGAQDPVRIVIEAIDVDAPIVQGDGWEELKKGVGHHLGSAQPGMRGNMVLAAHNDVFGEIFRDLNDLQAGDEVVVYTVDDRYTYVVRDKQILEPTKVSVMEPTHEPTATLITCYPYGIDSHRLVVFAELEP